jgi:putative ABC transport system ATP-binding protein
MGRGSVLSDTGSSVHSDASHIAIRSRDIKRHFQRGEYTVRAVDGITLDVRSGELVGIVGTSGSGKTTLLNLVGGLDTPTDGHLEVMGQRLDALDSRGLALYRRSVIGIVFQSFQLLPAQTAFENVALPLVLQNVARRERRSLVETALERVSLSDRMDHLPSELSAGQQQRVAIARALVKQPRLLLADEPTGNLDSRTSVEILRLLQQLNHEQQLTVVLVSHDENAVEQIADRVVRIEDGRLVTGGSS